MTAATQTLRSPTLAPMLAPTLAPTLVMPGDGRSFKVAGLAVAMLVPALFWVAVIAAVSNVASFPIGANSLTIVGAAISLFIGTVCAPLMLKAEV